MCILVSEHGKTKCMKSFDGEIYFKAVILRARTWEDKIQMDCMEICCEVD
jgi:hypothetical protein